MLGTPKNLYVHSVAAAKFEQDIKQRIDALSESWQNSHDAFSDMPEHMQSLLAVCNEDDDCEIIDQLQSCISTSLEALELSMQLHHGTDPITAPSAPYAVIRTAVEASSVGIWLGTTGTKKRMLSNSIKLSYRDNQNIIKIGEFDKTSNRGLLSNRREKKARLEEKFAMLNKDKKQTPDKHGRLPVARFTNDSRIVEIADQRIAMRRLSTAEESWRICSAFIHGSRDAMMGLGISHPTGKGNSRSEEVIQQRDPWTTISCIMPAVENCEKLIRVYRTGKADA